MKDGSLKIGQPIKSETLYGLRVDVTIEKVQEDKPLIFTYTYMLDDLKFKEWLKTVDYLTGGPLAFTGKGIQFMIVGGAKKYDKSAFSLSDENGEKVFLPLLQQEVQFIVRRDLFAGQEWEVSLVDSQIAAQTI